MRLERELVGDRLVVRVEGDLDVRSAEAFRRSVDEWLEATRARSLIVNLAAAGFVDSTGLGALLGRYRKLQAARRTMVLVAPPAGTLAVLELAGIPGLMPIVASEAEALEVAVG
ncbi:MAG: anti-sigma factor antagonist [Firmicutes bacterium]|nr:anti-sigma factor antagonist [Bacillota bacterium]